MSVPWSVLVCGWAMNTFAASLNGFKFVVVLGLDGINALNSLFEQLFHDFPIIKEAVKC